MNHYITTPRILAGLALTFATVLPSCVDPYAGGGASIRQVPSYRAGYEVSTLPRGYRTEVISGTSYYNYNGVYYRPRNNRYVVVEAPRPVYRNPGPSREVYVTRLPRGYRIEERNGHRYYRVRDTYYQQRGTGYVVVRP